MPEDIIQEVEKGKKEAAAGEGRTLDFSFYLVLDRIEGLRQEMKQEFGRLDGKIDGLRQEMKQDMGRLDGKIEGLRQEMKEEITSLRQEVKQEINSVRQEMKQEVSSLRQELKEDIRHIDGKINNIIWAAIGTFFAVLVGAAGIVVAIYYTVPR